MAQAKKVFDIRERAFLFAVRIVKLCRYLETKTKVSKLLIDQLLCAGTSIGANLQEAHSGESVKDFVHKNAISLKESRESKYWLRLLLATYDFPAEINTGITELEVEADELSKIIGKIIVNSRRKV